MGKGKPTVYTEEIGREICIRIACGEYLTKICEEDGMPAYRTVMEWDYDGRHGNGKRCPGFFEMYAEAKIARLGYWEEEMIRVSREPMVGTTIKKKQYVKKDGTLIDHEEVTTGDNVAARALYADSLKWVMGRIGHRTYGPKTPVDPDEGGTDGNKLIIEGGLPD